MRCILVNNLFNWIPQAFEKPLETVHTRDQRWIANRVCSYQNTRKNVLKMKIARLLWSAAREAVIWSALLLSIIQNVSYFNHEQLWNRKNKKFLECGPFAGPAWEDSRHLATSPLVSTAKRRLRNKCRNSVLMTCHYPLWVMVLIGWSNQPRKRTT